MSADNRRAYIRLFLVSFSILFLELALIRWIPAYLRAFGFFTNFVLLASLLGGGVGILIHRGSRVPLPPQMLFLTVLVLFVIRARYSLHISSTDVLFYGSGDSGREDYRAIPVVFALITLAFVPLGRELGKLFAALRRCPPMPLTSSAASRASWPSSPSPSSRSPPSPGSPCSSPSPGL